MAALSQSANQQDTSRKDIRFMDYPDEPHLEIRPYSKQELANLYGVHLNTISSWINRHFDAFAAIGYRKRLRVLDPCMIKLFRSIFSEP